MSPQFARLPAWLLDTEVSDGALRLYMALSLKAGSRGKCAPGQDQLADLAKCRASSLFRMVRQLVAVGAISVEERPGRRTVYLVHMDPVNVQATLPLGGTPTASEQSHGNETPTVPGRHHPAPQGGTGTASGRYPKRGDARAVEPPTGVIDTDYVRQETIRRKGKVRPRDLAFDALAEATGFSEPELTRTARSTIGTALADIRTGSPGLNGNLPAEIVLRADRYRRAHPGWELTPMALAKWWPQLTEDRAPPGVRDRAAEIFRSAIEEQHEPQRGQGDHRGSPSVLPSA